MHSLESEEDDIEEGEKLKHLLRKNILELAAFCIDLKKAR